MAHARKLAILCALSMTVAQGAVAQHLPDTVTTDVLRVCGDPGNMPFSERKEDGFENKIAAIIADELKTKVRYYWLTQGRLCPQHPRHRPVRHHHGSSLRQ